MLDKLIPYKPIRYIDSNEMKNVNLDNFFGFALAEIISPDENLLKNPILPFRVDETRVTHPRGSWIEVYFSEELKNSVKHGYSVKLIEGYEFEGGYLFNDYIEHFYENKKSVAKDSPAYYISKLHLNTFYGIFGKSKDNLETFLIKVEDLQDYLYSRILVSISKVGEYFRLILCRGNLNFQVINNLNLSDEMSVKNAELIYDENKKIPTKSNVAIAAAITSYGRIHISAFKNIPNTVIAYSDTDSIIIDSILPTSNELGGLKNEFGEGVIVELKVLGPKRYALKVEYPDGKIEIKTVFSGVKPNKLSWEDVLKISDNEKIELIQGNRFKRNFADLTIKVVEGKFSFVNITKKILQNNFYIPETIHSATHPIIKNRNIHIITYFKNRIKYFIKKHLD